MAGHVLDTFLGHRGVEIILLFKETGCFCKKQKIVLKQGFEKRTHLCSLANALWSLAKGLTLREIPVRRKSSEEAFCPDHWISSSLVRTPERA